VDELIQNKSPFAYASGDWFDLIDRSTCNASPNDMRMIIIIVVIISEVVVALHSGGIIA
jgi:hypothetical protein